MIDEVVSKEQNKKPLGKVHELLSKHSDGNPEQPNLKRERFLTHLKSQYGYTNERAVDELERLLKQFYRTNKSLGIRQARQNYVNSHVD